MDAYPAAFDQPCICDACGQDVEGETGCTCPETTLEQQIQKVRELRAISESWTQELHVLQVAFNQQHKALIESLCKVRNDCAVEEATLRELTMTAYAETGSKKPAEGVGIRVSKSLQYDENSAKHWAITNGHIMFLQLDRAGFEGWYKAQIKAKRELPPSMKESGLVVLEFEQAQPTIARDL
jgi:hypothetical protein